MIYPSPSRELNASSTMAFIHTSYGSCASFLWPGSDERNLNKKCPSPEVLTREGL